MSCGPFDLWTPWVRAGCCCYSAAMFLFSLPSRYLGVLSWSSVVQRLHVTERGQEPRSLSLLAFWTAAPPAGAGQNDKRPLREPVSFRGVFQNKTMLRNEWSCRDRSRTAIRPIAWPTYIENNTHTKKSVACKRLIRVVGLKPILYSTFWELHKIVNSIYYYFVFCVVCFYLAETKNITNQPLFVCLDLHVIFTDKRSVSNYRFSSLSGKKYIFQLDTFWVWAPLQAPSVNFKSRLSVIITFSCCADIITGAVRKTFDWF